MAITVEEAARVFGVTPATVRKWQKTGQVPKPIPDDFLDAVIDFRIKLESVFQRKYDGKVKEDAPSD
jgi:predicted site-specific integrase-resolvase